MRGVSVIPLCCCCTSMASLHVQFLVAFDHQRLASEERVTIRSTSVSRTTRTSVLPETQSKAAYEAERPVNLATPLVSTADVGVK